MRALAAGAIGGGAAIRFDEPVPRWVRWTLPAFLWLFRRLRFTGGCFLFSTRTAFEAVGGFDETLYASEELTLCRALQKQGEFVILRESVLTSGRKVRTYSGWEILRDSLRIAVAGRAGVERSLAPATSGTRRAGPTRASGAEPGERPLQRAARFASRKSQATCASARTPTSRLFSSMKKRGEWFGATSSGSWPSGMTPTKKNRPGTTRWKNEKSSEPMTLGTTCSLLRAGDALAASAPSPRSAPGR